MIRTRADRESPVVASIPHRATLADLRRAHPICALATGRSRLCLAEPTSSVLRFCPATGSSNAPLPGPIVTPASPKTSRRRSPPPTRGSTSSHSSSSLGDWPVLDATYTVLSRTLRAHHPRDSVILRPNGLSLPVEFDANRYLALHKEWQQRDTDTTRYTTIYSSVTRPTPKMNSGLPDSPRGMILQHCCSSAKLQKVG